MTAPALTSAQLSALLDILTHQQTLHEFTSLKYPGRTSCSGPPFKPGPDTPKQRPSPALNYMFRELALSLPGFRDAPEEVWSVQVQGLLERLAEQDLSDSYDKGLLGKRKILGQGVVVVAEYALRGVLGGLPRSSSSPSFSTRSGPSRTPSPKPEPTDRTPYDPEDPDDVLRAWDDFLQSLVWGDGAEDLVAWVSKTDKLEELPSLYRASHQYAAATLASFLHYMLTLSPCAHSTLSLIERVHGLLPYGLVAQAARVANAATMVSGVLKIFLSRGLLGALGFGSGQNLMQQIISSVLEKDKSNLIKQTKALESSASGPCGTPEQRAAILKYVEEASREERMEIRRQSAEQEKSIVAIILLLKSAPPTESETDHTNLLAYLSLHLAIRDRSRLLTALTSTTPDLLSEGVRAAMKAFEPLIRRLHKAVDLSAALRDLQSFLDDMLAVAKRREGPKSYLALFGRHQGDLHRFLHTLAKNSPEMRKAYLGWYRHCLPLYRQNSPPSSSSPSDDAAQGGAGDLSPDLLALFGALDADTQAAVREELDTHAEYMERAARESREKMRVLLAPGGKEEEGTQVGPGVFLKTWQDMIDKNPITPSTSSGPVRYGADTTVVRASARAVEDDEPPSSSPPSTPMRPTVEGGRPSAPRTIDALRESFEGLLVDRCLPRGNGR